MTGLLRTELSTPLKAELAASAFALQGIHGAMSGLAEDFAVSRPTVYAASKVAETVLHDHFHRAETGNEQTWVCVDRRQIERAIVALRVIAANSIRNIEDLLPILYPGVSRSFGAIQALCIQAQERAAEHNQGVCLDGITAVALDELFSQRQPVLTGVCLDTGYCFALSQQDHRGADEWTILLRGARHQGVRARVVVKDAARGIACAVSTVFPCAEQRDDCFHAHYEMSKAARTLERTAYRYIEYEEGAREDLDQLRRTGRGKGNRRSLAQHLARAVRRANKAIERYDAFFEAQREVDEALHFVDLETGRVRTPRQMVKALREAGAKMVEIDNQKAKKVGRYIINRAPGLALHLKSLRKALAKVGRKYGSKALQLGAVIYRLCGELEREREADRSRERREMLCATVHLLRGIVGDEMGSLLEAISEVMSKRHRASSAIEGFNAGVRPYLRVQKGVSQGFLELLRAHQNLRTRRWGRLKGRSAHEALTGAPVVDWLSELGYPPSAAPRN